MKLFEYFNEVKEGVELTRLRFEKDRNLRTSDNICQNGTFQ